MFSASRRVISASRRELVLCRDGGCGGVGPVSVPQRGEHQEDRGRGRQLRPLRGIHRLRQGEAVRTDSALSNTIYPQSSTVSIMTGHSLATSDSVTSVTTE